MARKRTIDDYFGPNGFIAPQAPEEEEEYYEVVFGPSEKVELPRERPLDEVFKTRSHVRILRALTILSEWTNLTGSDAARRAGISIPRAMEVLRELERAGVVRAGRAAAWCIWDLNPESPLHPLIRAAFDAEAALSEGTADASPS